MRMALNGPVSITSKLGVEQRKALEQLLFFNVNQHRVRHGIEHSIDTYGVPEIYEHEGGLRIRVGDTDGVQSLFAVSATGRPSASRCSCGSSRTASSILHLVVEPRDEFGELSNTPVLLKLMHEIRGAARRTRGVDRIELVYKDRRTKLTNGLMRLSFQFRPDDDGTPQFH
jgi:hypothetical protein